MLLAAVFVNLLLVGPALRMGAHFTAGLCTGVSAGWLVFAVSGWIALKRPGTVFDERTAAHMRNAAAFSFFSLCLPPALVPRF